MTTKPLETAWQKFDASEARVFKVIAPLVWVIVFLDLVHRFETGNFVGGVSNIGMIAIFSAVMVGPKCFGIIEAKSGSNSQKALAIITLFGVLILLAGMVIKLLAFMR